MIGSVLVKRLRDKGLHVTEYDVQRQLSEDLTHSGYNTNLQHCMWQCDFVYFLAFDVGGAKYLGDMEKTFAFVHNNMRMMVNVFDALSLCKTPFIFSSSMMTKMPWSSYGGLKRIGESYTFATGGTNIRFWNVYGKEPQSQKSHVITDFCHQAATTGKIQIMTDGDEWRQFLHVDDAVTALEALREGSVFDVSSRPADFDISSGRWTKIKTIAKLVSTQFGGVPVIPGPNYDLVQRDARPEPELKHIQGLPYHWKPTIPLAAGIKQIAKEFKNNDD